jgi:LysM repeat protein
MNKFGNYSLFIVLAVLVAGCSTGGGGNGTLSLSASIINWRGTVSQPQSMDGATSAIESRNVTEGGASASGNEVPVNVGGVGGNPSVAAGPHATTSTPKYSSTAGYAPANTQRNNTQVVYRAPNPVPYYYEESGSRLSEPEDAPMIRSVNPNTLPRPYTKSQNITHTVVKGDTVYDLAKKYGTSEASIVKANKLANKNKLKIGQRLIIPR